MKPLFLSLFLLSICACRKENLLPNSQEQAAFLKIKDVPVEPSSDDCDAVLAAWRQANQVLANQLCDTVWGDWDCVFDGLPTYWLVYVAPNDPGCFPTWDSSVE